MESSSIRKQKNIYTKDINLKFENNIDRIEYFSCFNVLSPGHHWDHGVVHAKLAVCVDRPQNKWINEQMNKWTTCHDSYWTSLQQERVKYLTLNHTKIKNVFSFKQIIANDKHCLLKKLCCFIRKINKMCSPI